MHQVGDNYVFTKEEFIRQYNLLSGNSNALDKESANQYILQFQQCNQVWQISREMILDPPSPQIQVLGAQILCKKLKNHYSQLTPQQKLELRKFLFSVLSSYCQVGNSVISKLTKNQIVHSIAILGFTGIFSDWTTFVEDICAFMRLEKYLYFIYHQSMNDNCNAKYGSDKYLYFQPSLFVLFNINDKFIFLIFQGVRGFISFLISDQTIVAIKEINNDRQKQKNGSYQGNNLKNHTKKQINELQKLKILKIQVNNIVKNSKNYNNKQEGSDEYFISGIEILENVANQENMEKIVNDMKAFQRIRSLFQGQSQQLSEIFNALLVHPNSNVGLKTLECIESWAGSQFKYQVFIDENLVKNIIILLSSTSEEVFEKVANIMLEGIKNSNNADILETANVAKSFNLLRVEEVSSLKVLIDALALRVNDFLTVEQINQQSKFCKYYAEIVTEIAQRFSILILEDSEHSKKLLQLMVICTQHSNRGISYITFDFWVSFYRTLKKFVPNITDPSSDWLIEPYLEIFKTVLSKSKLKKINIAQSQSSLPVQDEVNGEGNSQSDYVKKKNKKTYQLLKKYSLFQDGDEGLGFCGDFSSSQFKIDEFGVNDSGDEDFFMNQPLSFDLDQIDSTFAKIRVKDYRVHARDIFNTVYNVLSQFRGQQGINSLLSILYTLIDKSQFLSLHTFTDNNEAMKQYYISVEVCLFVVQTMAENMFLGGSQEENNCFTYFFEFIVNNNEFPAHQSTVYMAMQLFYNAQTELSKNEVLFDSTIKFILRYILDENLGFMSSQTFSGIIKGVGQNDAIETFRYVAKFFVQNVNNITKPEVMDELIQGVFGFALNLKTPEYQVEAIQNLLSLVQQIIDNTKTSLEIINEAKEKETCLLRAIGIFQSLLCGFSTEQITIEVKTNIGQFVLQNFNFLTLAFDALTMKSNAQPIISQFINIFRYVIKIFSDQSNNPLLYQQYISFLNTSILISQRSPILFCETMKIFRMIIDLTKNSESNILFLQWLEQNFNQYNEFYIKFMTSQNTNHNHSLNHNNIHHNNQYYPSIQIQHQLSQQDKNKDPDLITNFYDIQLQLITYFALFYLNHNCFRSVIEFSFDVVKNISQYEMTRSIIKFYYEFIKHCSHFPETQEFVLKILETTIDILPTVNSNLMHNIASLFMKFVDINKDQAQQLNEYILKCFNNNNKYQQFTINQKKILVDCIMKFSLESNNLILMKSLLSDLYSVFKGLSSTQEMFMNYEMKLKGLNHCSTSQQIHANQSDNQSSSLLTNNINSSSINYFKQNCLNQLSNTLLVRNQNIKNASDLDDLFN